MKKKKVYYIFFLRHAHDYVYKKLNLRMWIQWLIKSSVQWVSLILPLRHWFGSELNDVAFPKLFGCYNSLNHRTKKIIINKDNFDVE